MSFESLLKYGLAGESAIAAWLRHKGFSVLPVYEKIVDTGKGPQLYTPDTNLIAPDLLAFKGSEKVLWVEAKRKAAFVWYGIHNRFVTGIDLKHYLHYCEVADRAPWPIVLLFLQEGGQAKNSPPSPAGLYGNYLSYLREHEDNRADQYGVGGMVFWALNDLLLYASLDEVNDAVHSLNHEVGAPA